jgi:CBS domain-containing protein
VFHLDGVELNRLLVKDIMTTNATYVKKGETIANAISTMKNTRLRELPVLDGDKPIGCVTYNSFLTRRQLPFTSKVEQFMQPCPRIEEDMPLTDATEELISSGVRGAPVMRAGKVVGFISRTDIIKILPQVDYLKDRKITSFMTASPQAVKEKETVRRAQILMKTLDEKVVPVVDDEFRLIGAIGMTEIIDTLWSFRSGGKAPGIIWGGHDKDAPDVAIGSVMARPAISLSADGTLAQVANTMIKNNISVVFVVEGEKLIGVVSQADLMEQVVSLKQKEGVYVQITGLEEGDPDVYAEMYSMIEKVMQSINKVDPPLMFTIHVTMFHQEGLRSKYSLHGRLSTKRKLFFVRSFDWSLLKALSELLDLLEKDVMKEHDVRLTSKKHKPTNRDGSSVEMNPR